MVNKFRKGDSVIVISGKDKGKKSSVLKMLLKKNRVLVKDVNIVKKHTKPSKANPEGGIIMKEMPIDVSNLMHFDLKANVATRVGIKINDKNKKVRYYKKSENYLEVN